VTCGSKSGVGGIFSFFVPFSVSHYLFLVFSSTVYSALMGESYFAIMQNAHADRGPVKRFFKLMALKS